MLVNLYLLSCFRAFLRTDGGRCWTLTLKKSDFTQVTRSKTVSSVVSQAADLKKIMTPILNAELPVEARLLGVRASTLAGPLIEADKAVQDPTQSRLDCFFTSTAKRKRCATIPEEEDEEEEECEDDDDAVPPMPDSPARASPPARPAGEAASLDGAAAAASPGRPAGEAGPAAASASASTSSSTLVTCPICEKKFTEWNMNHHLDLCLNAASGLVPSRRQPGGRGKRRRSQPQQARMDAFVTRGK